MDVDVAIDGRRFECIFDSMSIFSSFSSNKSFNSLTSASNERTLSSNDSVYPLGNALRLSLSLVLHSNPTFEHCEQHGRIPSHRIFLLLQRSQAWAIRLCELDPTLITFIGSIPGILLVVTIYPDVICCSCSCRPASAIEFIEVQGLYLESCTCSHSSPQMVKQRKLFSVVVPENPKL